MMRRLSAVALTLALLGGCATPEGWEGMLGTRVTIEGAAADEKLGAVLVLDDGGVLWIDGLDAWPEGYYEGGDRGKRLRVTGTLIRRDDLPVFVSVPGEPQRAGIPVATEAEAARARVRYLLADAVWESVD